MHTNHSILTAHGISLDSIEHPELEIPILTGPQPQGDVLIVPAPGMSTFDMPTSRPIGKGVTVVRAERDQANTHSLHGDGFWAPNDRADTQLLQGWLTVPAGGEAFLIHTEEHSALGIGPGDYEVRRQREFAGEWRRVAD